MVEVAPADWNSMIHLSVAFDMEFDTGKDSVYPSAAHGTIFQLPSPPSSHLNTPQEAYVEPDDGDVLSLSTTFYPGFRHQSRTPDLIIVSVDVVHFHVHTQTLMEASDNRFQTLFPALSGTLNGSTPTLHVIDHSSVLNVVIHAIYNMSCVHFTPSFSILCTAVSRLITYGVNPKSLILPSSHLYTHLLGYAPCTPLAVYALAAFWDLRALAVETSSHLVSFKLANITDAQAGQMGAVYLKRLYFLHLGRVEALKRILQPPPAFHRPTDDCDFADQKRLTKAWGLASSYLVWDSKPELPPSKLQQTMNGLATHLDCDLCRQTLSHRTQEAVDQWSMVKVTIS